MSARSRLTGTDPSPCATRWTSSSRPASRLRCGTVPATTPLFCTELCAAAGRERGGEEGQLGVAAVRGGGQPPARRQLEQGQPGRRGGTGAAAGAGAGQITAAAAARQFNFFLHCNSLQLIKMCQCQLCAGHPAPGGGVPVLGQQRSGQRRHRQHQPQGPP